MNPRFDRLEWIIIIAAVFFMAFLVACPDGAQAGDRQLTILYEQAEDDLPDLDHWELFKSLDSAQAWPWEKVGDIPYDGNPNSEYNADFTITVPDGAETSLWFKMTAVDKAGNSSAASEEATPAPIVIDFKPPAAVTDLAGDYDNQPKTVTLTWSTDPADTDIATQTVFYSSTAGGPYTEAGSGTSPYIYQVPQGGSGKWIYFVVVLTDNDGNYSANSNEAAVRLSMGVPFNLKVTVTAQ